MKQNIEQEYLSINKALWDEKTKHHVASEFYAVPEFMAGSSSLKGTELELLGNIKGLTVLHLQCHFGQDSLSLARMGAKVTGVDLSSAAIDTAVDLNKQLGLDARFICSDVYGLPNVLDEQFDIVFTSYGVIGWLPDMDVWGGVVSRFLKPGGRFVFVEFHPVVWMFSNDFSHVQYSYFNKEAIVETLEGTYADSGAPIKMPEVGWNHPISEVLKGLIEAGLSIRTFQEHDFSHYNCFANMVPAGDGTYYIQGMEGKLPLMYSLVGTK